MASIYPKQGKYWLKYFDHVADKWRDKPTPLRYPEDRRAALELKLETTLAESKHRVHGARHEARWGAWVPGYLKSRYGRGKTYNRYVHAWTHIEGFLEEKGITSPAAWTAQHNAQYVDWKEAQGYRRQPAIWDLGALAMLMNEAKRRDFLPREMKHKVSKARIRAGEVEEKPALTDEQITQVREGIVKRATEGRDERTRNAWNQLAVAFEIGLHTGCRIAETAVPFDRIDLNRGTHGVITFIPKGGKKRIYAHPIIFPEFKTWLAGVMTKRRAAGFSTTCDISGTGSRDFGRLCRALKLKGPEGEKITFHCTRVNFVTRAFMAGLDAEVIRKLVNHADALINRLYQRFSIEGLAALGAKLNLPVVSAADPLQIASATPTPRRRAASRRPKADRRASTGKASCRNNRAPRPVRRG